MFPPYNNLQANLQGPTTTAVSKMSERLKEGVDDTKKKKKKALLKKLMKTKKARK